MDIDKEELKNEAKETVNQVKDTIKNVDFNKEAKATKGLLRRVCTEPFEIVENVATGKEELFARSVILVILNIALIIIAEVLMTIKIGYGTFWGLVKNAVSPVIAILIPTIIIFITNKNNKKSATTIISTLTIASIPSILAVAVRIIKILFSNTVIITAPVTTTLSAVAIILAFFGMKTLYGEEKTSFLPKFVLIEIITELVMNVIL